MNKNKPTVALAASGAVVLLVSLAGCAGPSPDVANTKVPVGTSGGGPGGSGGGPGGSGGAPGGSGGGQGGSGGNPSSSGPAGTTAPSRASTVPAGKPVKVASKRGHDPFLITWKLPAPPPYAFQDVAPIRLAADAVEITPPIPVEIREQPTLRVSGIMNGEGVFAILEKTDGVDIVKPGSEVKITAGSGERTYRVVAINANTVKLRSQEGNRIYIQEIPLSDVPIGTQTGFGGGRGSGGIMPSTGGGSGGGIPGSGGGIPGRKGRPIPGGAGGASGA